METIFDWATVAVFAGIAVLFLQRSIGPPRKKDGMIRYVPPVLLCAVANWLGNEGHAIWATVLVILAIGYTILILKPGSSLPDIDS